MYLATVFESFLILKVSQLHVNVKNQTKNFTEMLVKIVQSGKGLIKPFEIHKEASKNYLFVLLLVQNHSNNI